MPVLAVRNLKKSYGTLRAVDDVSFAIDSGEIFGLLGPNGAGKSTTINIIASILAAEDGAVEINGVNLAAGNDYRRKIGYVPQEISLNDKLTARENLSLIGRLYDLAGSRLAQRVDATLESVGLADRGRDNVGAFSGGMKRRLNIAAALLHEPDLVLMDEPTAGVDPQARAYIFDIVERLASQGRAVLYTTHYMEEAQRLCRRTAIVDHGRILAIGTLDELVQRLAGRRDLVIEAPGLTPKSAEQMAARLGYQSGKTDAGMARLRMTNIDRPLSDAIRAAEELGLKPTGIRIDEPNLETVFLELTGRALRD